MSDIRHLSTFEEAARDALQIGARMSLKDRIRWLEEAEELGLQLQRWRWQAGLKVDPRLAPLFEKREGNSLAVAEERCHDGPKGDSRPE